MNNNEVSTEEQAVAQEMLALCLQITSQGQYWAWFDFAPHVNWIEVRISKVVDDVGNAVMLVNERLRQGGGEARSAEMRLLRDRLREYLLEAAHA